MKRLVAEFLGTALLLSIIVGSGVVASTDPSDAAALFQHAVAVGAGLVALILAFGPVSGAHFNPVVTAADWWFGGIAGRDAVGYVAAQVLGAVAGTVATNLMFEVPAIGAATTLRDGWPMFGGEVVATVGLLVVIFALVHTGRTSAVPAAVGAWIMAAIYSTSSAAFANPAVTLARMATDSWTGIAPRSAPLFLLGQAAGLLAAILLIKTLYAPSDEEARDVIVPHESSRP